MLQRYAYAVAAGWVSLNCWGRRGIDFCVLVVGGRHMQGAPNFAAGAMEGSARLEELVTNSDRGAVQ